MAQGLVRSTAGSLRVEDHDVDEEEKESTAFLDGYVQEAASVDVDLNVESAKKIKDSDEAIRMQFKDREQVQQAHQKGQELARLGEKLAEDHADEIQRLADKTDLNEVPVTVEEVASKLFPEQETPEKNISTGRVVALLSYCYELIKKIVTNKIVISVAAAGAIAFVSFILNKVLDRIGFFKWLLQKGGWKVVQWIADEVAAGRSWWYGPASASASTPTAASTCGPIVVPVLLPRAGNAALRFFVRNGTSSLRVIISTPVVLPVTFLGGVIFCCYWWKRKSD